MADAQLKQLLAAARAGEVERVGEMLESFRSYLLLIAEQELTDDIRPKLGASDLVQQSLANACQRIGQFQGRTREELTGWLRKILLNQLADVRRRQRARKRIAREVSLGTSSVRRKADGAMANNGPSPSAEIHQRETSLALHQAIEKLPPDYRQVIYLRHRDDCSFAEIAAKLGRSEDAIQKLWARALRKLQQLMGEDGPAS